MGEEEGGEIADIRPPTPHTEELREGRIRRTPTQTTKE